MNWRQELLLGFLNLRDSIRQMDEMTPELARKQFIDSLFLANLLFEIPVSIREKKNQLIDGRNGKIPIRIYKNSDKENQPVIVYFHGGGFVIGNIRTHDRVCQRLCKHCDAIVVSVDYRLAPEHKIPAAIYDAYDATKWVSENAISFGGDPAKIAVAGDSAGGNLSAVITFLARENKSPNIAAQVLIYPLTDATHPYPSYEKYSKGYLLTKRNIDFFEANYLNKNDSLKDPMLSPMYQKDHQNLPPAFVITAGYDPLKDEGKAYADKLQSAGNKVLYREYKDLVHGFVNIPKLSKEAGNVTKDIASFLNDVL